MQLSDVRTRVRYNIRETVAETWLDAELTAQINLAQRYVAGRLDPDYLPQLVLEKTAATNGSTLNFDLAADFLKMAGEPYVVITVGGTEIFPIVSAKEAYIVKSYDSNHLQYQKKVSWLADNDIYFSKAPATGNYYYPYVQYPADLSGDSDVSEIQDSVIDLVIQKATYDALLKTRNINEMKIILSVLEKRIDDLNKKV